MKRYFRGHRLVEFRNDVDEVKSGLEPFPRVFFIARNLIAEQMIEVRPLTARAFFGAVLRNILWDVIWGARQLCWRIGFLDFDERRMAVESYRGAWRWRWWLPRVGSGPKLDPKKVYTLGLPAAVGDWRRKFIDEHLRRGLISNREALAAADPSTFNVAVRRRPAWWVKIRQWRRRWTRRPAGAAS